jgi:sulfur relay protein TusB/DsrH
MLQNCGALSACLARMTQDAALLLVEDAAILALATYPQAGLLSGYRVHVLREDLQRLGLTEQDLAAFVRPIDMAGFVQLAVAHTSQIVWSAS